MLADEEVDGDIEVGSVVADFGGYGRGKWVGMSADGAGLACESEERLGPRPDGCGSVSGGGARWGVRFAND